MKVYCVLFCTIVVIGCASQYTFRNVGTRSDDHSSYDNTAGQGDVKFTIDYKGIKKNWQDKSLEFAMDLRNVGSKTVIIEPGAYVLLDDENCRLKARVIGRYHRIKGLYSQHIPFG